MVLEKTLRMSEFNAALERSVQIDRLKDIVEWKNEKVSKDIKNYSNYLKLPEWYDFLGSYKVLVFDEIRVISTGKVYDIGCHKNF